MRYKVIESDSITVIHVIEQNIFFGYDESEDYLVFREGLEIKGIDAFVDLLIEDSNTAFAKFTAFNG